MTRDIRAVEAAERLRQQPLQQVMAARARAATMTLRTKASARMRDGKGRKLNDESKRDTTTATPTPTHMHARVRAQPDTATTRTPSPLTQRGPVSVHPLLHIVGPRDTATEEYTQHRPKKKRPPLPVHKTQPKVGTRITSHTLVHTPFRLQAPRHRSAIHPTEEHHPRPITRCCVRGQSNLRLNTQKPEPQHPPNSNTQQSQNTQ